VIYILEDELSLHASSEEFFFTYNVRTSHQTDLKGMSLLHTLLYVNVTRLKRANHIPFLLIGFMLLGMLDIS